MLRDSFLVDQDTTLGAFQVIGILSGFSGSFLLTGAGDGDCLGRLADLDLGGGGDIDLGRGAGVGAGARTCLGGDNEGLAGLGGDEALIGAGDGFLLSRDIDLRGGPENFLLSGLLYSNLIASLILALLEAVLANERFRSRCPRLGETDLLLVLRLLVRLPLLITLLDLSFFLFSLSDNIPGSRGLREFLQLS